MVLAFFLAYPVVLILWAFAGLCRLLGCPLPAKKVDRWLAIIQLGFFIPLIIIGLVDGMYAMGNSEHFRTAHGV